MAEVVLHIGLHKTGTKAIQAFCTRNAAWLRGQGIDYPAGGRPERYRLGHHLVPWSLEPASAGLTPVAREELSRDPGALLAALAGAAGETARTVLLSSEDFSNLTSLAPLRQALQAAGFRRITVVCYLRRQDEYLEALYGTWVAHFGHSAPFNIDEMAQLADYARRLAPWAQTFGHEAVRVFRYDRAIFPEGNVVRHFLGQVLGVTKLDGAKFFDSDQNPTYPKEVLDRIVALRRAGAPEAEISRVKAGATGPAPGIGRASFMSDVERRQLLQGLEPINRAVSAEFIDGEPLFPT